MSVFYAFSVIVLTFRICYYAEVIILYKELDKYRELFVLTPRPSYFQSYLEMYNVARRVGVYFTCADYSKFALGFF